MISARLGFMGSTIHPEAANWAARVVANSGSVTATTLAAVNTFCQAIDTAGIRGKFVRLNLLCGTGLPACLVPLYRGTSLTETQYGGTTDDNANFVDGDYTETGTSGGLNSGSSNTTKYLRTGMDAVTAGLANTDTHIAWYSRAQINASGAGNVAGAFGGGVPQSTWQSLLFGSLNLLFFRSGGASSCGLENVTLSGANRSGHLITQRSGSSAQCYRQGSDLGLTATTTNTNTWSSVSPGAPYIFARNNGGSADQLLSARLQMYSLGTSFTSTQASAYSSAVQAFQTSLTRNL
jgi:hypothetical protein